MHSSSPSRSCLIALTTTTAGGVEHAAQQLPTNTDVGSTAWYVRKTLDAHAEMLWQLTAYLVCSSSPPETPPSVGTSPRGGPGAAAPKPTHTNKNPDPLTGAPKSGGPTQEEPPYELPQEWSKDSDLAFQALTDEDVPPDFEDGICGP